MLGCMMKLCILLIIRNTILLLICSSLLCWLKKELQGCQPMKMKTSLTPRQASMTSSRTATPSGAHSSTTPSAWHAASTSLTPFGAVPHAMDSSMPSILQGKTAVKPSSSTISTGHTSDIKCHHCHDIDHF
jgi:hypothetical protein